MRTPRRAFRRLLILGAIASLGACDDSAPTECISGASVRVIPPTIVPPVLPFEPLPVPRCEIIIEVPDLARPVPVTPLLPPR